MVITSGGGSVLSNSASISLADDLSFKGASALSNSASAAVVDELSAPVHSHGYGPSDSHSSSIADDVRVLHTESVVSESIGGSSSIAAGISGLAGMSQLGDMVATDSSAHDLSVITKSGNNQYDDYSDDFENSALSSASAVRIAPPHTPDEASAADSKESVSDFAPSMEEKFLKYKASEVLFPSSRLFCPDLPIQEGVFKLSSDGGFRN